MILRGTLLMKNVLCGLTLVFLLTAANGVIAAPITTPVQSIFNDKNNDNTFDSDDYFNPNYTYTLSAQQFNDNGGTLDLLSVTLTLEGFMEGIFKFENMSEDSVSEVDGTLASLLSLFTTSGVNLVTVLPAFSFERTLSIFDGDFDYAGTSGDSVQTTPAPVVAQNTVTITDSSILAQFIGTGSIDLNIKGESNSEFKTDGGSVLNIPEVNSAGTLDIFYTYENSVKVAAPSSFLIFALAITLLSLRLRFNK